MRGKRWLAAGLATVMLVGCQPNPAESIVVDKDMENLLEEAQKEKVQTFWAEVEEVEEYRTTIANEALGIRVDVDAVVDVPTAEQMSIYRVEQAEFTQEFLDLVRETLAPDVTWYEGNVLNVKTRAEYEEEIARTKEHITNVWEISVKEEYQRELDKLQIAYESASETVDWSNYPSDGLIHSVEELYNRNTADDFYSWEYSLNEDGDVFFAVSDGSDGNYYSLFIQNNPERSNCLRFRKGNGGHEFVTTAIPGGTTFYTTPYADVTLTAIEEEKEVIALHLDEAVAMADQCLEVFGLEMFSYYEGGLFRETLDNRWSETDGTRDAYVLRYMREVDGASVIFSESWQMFYGTTSNGYTKKDWPVECIEFRITDDGIVGFDYHSPIAITETVVENVSLNTWAKTREIFERMMPIKYAEKAMEGNAEIFKGETLPEIWVTYYMDRAKLGYTRVSEPDNFESGLLVPTWDFFGERCYFGEKTYNGEVDYGNWMTINAVDGTMINRYEGY